MGVELPVLSEELFSSFLGLWTQEPHLWVLVHPECTGTN